MASATTIDEAVTRLITKAGYRWAADRRDQYHDGRTRLNAFGQVAADCLGACGTPFAFEMAVRDTLADRPLPATAGLTREAAVAARALWEADFTEAVLAALSDN